MTPDLTNPARVLVVDDNKDVVELLELLLTHHGLTVLKAYGGAGKPRVGTERTGGPRGVRRDDAGNRWIDRMPGALQ